MQVAGAEDPDNLIAGRYRLGARLGRGGMAEVFDAFDERLQRRVALKVLRPEVAVHADMRQRFEREARAAARLSHPSVVSVYDTGEDGGRAFLVMERLPGETLADRISQGPVDQVWLRGMALDVLGALGAAHEIGLLHRDVKPGNVLITTEDRVKVADFGIAKMMTGTQDGDGDLTAIGLVLGTPAYLAPERLAGQQATVDTDLFALGVVLYEAASGRKPPPGAFDPTIAGTGAGSGDISQFAPGIDPVLARVIRRAMAPRAEDRYPSAEAMAADLRRRDPPPPPTVVVPPAAPLRPATRVIPVAAELPQQGAVVERSRARGPLLAIAALVGVLIVVVILILVSSSSSNGPSPTTSLPPESPTTPATPATTPTTTASTTTTTTSTTTASTPPTTPTTTASTTPTTKATTTTTTTTTPSITKPTIPGPSTGAGGIPSPGGATRGAASAGSGARLAGR